MAEVLDAAALDAAELFFVTAFTGAFGIFFAAAALVAGAFFVSVIFGVAFLIEAFLATFGVPAEPAVVFLDDVFVDGDFVAGLSV